MDITLPSCPFCDSSNVARIQDEIDLMIGNVRVLCRSCGATASENYWISQGNARAKRALVHQEALSLLKTNMQVFYALTQKHTENDAKISLDAYLVNKSFCDMNNEK
jgi:ribosomal protein L37AE/L43A